MVSRRGKGIVKLHCHFPNLVGIPKKKKLHKLHYFSQLELEIFLQNSLPFCVIVLNFVGIGLKVVSNPCFLRKKGRKQPHNSRFQSISKFQLIRILLMMKFANNPRSMVIVTGLELVEFPTLNPSNPRDWNLDTILTSILRISKP